MTDDSIGNVSFNSNNPHFTPYNAVTVKPTNDIVARLKSKYIDESCSAILFIRLNSLPEKNFIVKKLRNFAYNKLLIEYNKIPQSDNGVDSYEKFYDFLLSKIIIYPENINISDIRNDPEIAGVNDYNQLIEQINKIYGFDDATVEVL